MKTINLVTMLGLFTVLSAFVSETNSSKFYSKNTHIDFYSETPLETIEAISETAVAAIDIETGDVQFKVSIMSFQFEKKLMQEHFNENYMESSDFPYATFSGKITNMNAIELGRNGENQVTVKGTLTMHGVSKEITVNGNLNRDGQIIDLYSQFYASPKDYDIKIPGAVEGKIADQIRITVKAKLQELNR